MTDPASIEVLILCALVAGLAFSFGYRKGWLDHRLERKQARHRAYRIKRHL